MLSSKMTQFVQEYAFANKVKPRTDHKRIMQYYYQGYRRVTSFKAWIVIMFGEGARDSNMWVVYFQTPLPLFRSFLTKINNRWFWLIVCIGRFPYGRVAYPSLLNFTGISPKFHWIAHNILRLFKFLPCALRYKWLVLSGQNLRKLSQVSVWVTKVPALFCHMGSFSASQIRKIPRILPILLSLHCFIISIKGPEDIDNNIQTLKLFFWTPKKQKWVFLDLETVHQH